MEIDELPRSVAQYSLPVYCFIAIFCSSSLVSVPIDTRRFMVQHQELDLGVGDVIRIGGSLITVIDIENGEITFRIDDVDPPDEDRPNDLNGKLPVPLPR